MIRFGDLTFDGEWTIDVTTSPTPDFQFVARFNTTPARYRAICARCCDVVSVTLHARVEPFAMAGRAWCTASHGPASTVTVRGKAAGPWRVVRHG